MDRSAEWVCPKSSDFTLTGEPPVSGEYFGPELARLGGWVAVSWWDHLQCQGWRRILNLSAIRMRLVPPRTRLLMRNHPYIFILCFVFVFVFCIICIFYQNEARPASYQTFDEEPSMIPHAVDSTLENRYKINPCFYGVWTVGLYQCFRYKILPSGLCAEICCYRGKKQTFRKNQDFFGTYSGADRDPLSLFASKCLK